MTDMNSQNQTMDSDENPESDRSTWGTISLMFMAILAMTSCCILPLALVSLGVTGVFIGKLGSLYQYHWYFLAFAMAALTYGFWKAYRPVNTENCADGTCAQTLNRTLVRSVMWLSLVVVFAAQLFQYLAPYLLNPF